MAVIYSSELFKANSSQMLTILDDIITTSDNLTNKINTFISSSNGHLSGDAFTLINAKLSIYTDALTKQKKICANLKSNVIAANNTMINYMEGYEKIDDSQKDTIKSLINQINSSIQILESQDKITTTSLQSDINKLYVMSAELNKQYQKIEGLAAADISAFSKLTTVNMDVDNYNSAIRAVQIGWSNVFYNLGNRDVLYYDQRGYYNADGEFVEWESKWRTSNGEGIREAGCGPASYAAVIGTMFHDSSITPATIADIMYEHGWMNGAEFIARVSSVYGVNCTQAKFSADTIEAVIKSGGGFIGSANNGGHYIAITDVVYVDGTKYFVLCDPWPEFNGNRAEPTLVTEQEIKTRKISMDFYITPADTVIVADEYGNISGIEKI